MKFLISIMSDEHSNKVKTRSIGLLERKAPLFVLILGIGFLNTYAQEGSGLAGTYIKNSEFTKNSLFAPQYQQNSSSIMFLDPSRFSMQQSYSTAYTYSSGSSQSYGMYLNTLSYQVFKPLVFSLDLGIYTPFYSSGIYQGKTGGAQLSQAGKFILPRAGLDYSPTKNTHFSIQYFNLNSTPGYPGYFLR
jgi:hypothetical protein